MPSDLRFASLLLTAGLLLVIAAPARAEVGALYLNNYGSDWDVWLRGHSVLKEIDRDAFLKAEPISVKPNHIHPQSFIQAGHWSLAT